MTKLNNKKTLNDWEDIILFLGCFSEAEKPGDLYHRGYEQGWEAGYQDSSIKAYIDGWEPVLKIDNLLYNEPSDIYKAGYDRGYEQGFEEGQAELN